MATKKKLSEKVKQAHLEGLKRLGSRGFYERAVGGGMLQTSKIEHPEIVMLEISEAFFALYRSTGEENYATISKLLRKAAHTVFRELKKQKSPTKDHKRFLRLCS